MTNQDKIDDVVLALLQLTAHGEENAMRAWKGQSWEVMDRLHQKGWISDPKSKAKSVLFTEEGWKRSELLYELLFEDDGNRAVKPPNSEGIRIRISLKGSDPEIWREIGIPADLRLSELHEIIQIVMGWQNVHLHQFFHKKQIFGVPNLDDWQEVLDEDEYFASEFLLRKGSRITYEYDFGDSWIHEIVRMGKLKKGDPLFEVTDGAMACPPEDCGGVWGYQQLLQALENELHPEHKNYTEWVGGSFDPKKFDPEKISERIRQVLITDS
jgi:hypothetical protein